MVPYEFLQCLFYMKCVIFLMIYFLQLATISAASLCSKFWYYSFFVCLDKCMCMYMYMHNVLVSLAVKTIDFGGL